MNCKKCGQAIEFDMAGTGVKGEDDGHLDIQVQCSNEDCLAVHYTFIPASDLMLTEHAERLIADYKRRERRATR